MAPYLERHFLIGANFLTLPIAVMDNTAYAYRYTYSYSITLASFPVLPSAFSPRLQDKSWGGKDWERG